MGPKKSSAAVSIPFRTQVCERRGGGIGEGQVAVWSVTLPAKGGKSFEGED